VLDGVAASVATTTGSVVEANVVVTKALVLRVLAPASKGVL
jgi:hypothetical protein